MDLRVGMGHVGGMEVGGRGCSGASCVRMRASLRRQLRHPEARVGRMLACGESGDGVPMLARGQRGGGRGEAVGAARSGERMGDR